jgi:integrase
MKANELRNDKLIKRWLSGKRATQETEKSYVQSMQMFTEFVKRTPEELILEAEAEIKAGLLMRERKIDSYLLDFREDQESQNLSSTTVKTRLAAVMSFYKHYNIQLPVLPRSVRKARPELKRKAIPTKDDIREILKFADIRDRAMLLIGVSSGLSIIDIANLKVGDFKSGYDPVTEITTLHIVRTKINYEFYTFLSPEASKAVNDYLDWRGRQEDGKKVTGDDGYLFITYEIPPEYRTTKKEELRKLNKKSLIERYRDLNEASGKKAEFGEYNLIRSHNMRRFLSSKLLANGASIFFADFILGHELDGTRIAYYRADPDSLKAEYKKYIPFITIEKSLDISESEEFKQIKAEHITLIVEAEKHRIERSELQELRAELEAEKTGKEAHDQELIEKAKKEAIIEFTKVLAVIGHDGKEVSNYKDHLISPEFTDKLKTEKMNE